MDLTKLSLLEAKKLIHSKAISASELVEAFIREIEQAQELNAYITTTLEHAKKQAKYADNQSQKRVLEGLPIGIKDNFCTQGILTTAGSKALENFIPPYDATIYKKLCLDSGAIMVGKCNMDDFALGSSNKTSAYGYCINPWKKKDQPHEKLVPGGSSGGSAAAVAAKLALATTGSDTGGSIRQPASLCGVVGLKSTYGLVSRWGLIAFASSLDVAGSINKNVTDAALMLNIMAGYDPKDPSSLNIPKQDYLAKLGWEICDLKIGILSNIENTSSSINNNLQLIRQIIHQLKGQVIDINIETMKHALNVYYIIAPAEGFSNFAQYNGIKYGYQATSCKTIQELYLKSRTNSLGEEVKRRILIGAFILSSLSKNLTNESIYSKALKVSQMIRNEFDAVFEKVDVLVIPTTYDGAPGLDEKISEIDMYMSDFFTVVANIIGIPSISIPVSLNQSGLPTSIQILGRKLSEQTILQVAYALEQQIQFNHEATTWWKKNA